MAKDVEVVILDQTKPISKKGFGLPLVFVPDTNVEYKEVEGTDGLTTLVSGDMGYEMVSAAFSQEPNPDEIAVYGVDIIAAGSTITDEMNDLLIEHSDFYFILLASRTQSDIEEMASWAGANGKLFITQPDITTDASAIVTMAETISSSRTGIFAHDGGIAVEEQYLDAAITGRMAPTDPGSSTWKFQNLNGVSVATYTNTDQNTLLDANVNSYVRRMGVDMTSEGKETGGGFLDIQRAKDWMKARIEESVFFLLYNSEKVPYDSPGIGLVVEKLKSVLKLAVRRKVIATDADGNGMWEVSVPTRNEIADNDIANRILPDIDFVATVAGAVHKVEIEGVLQV
ncbi:MAG: DUF3383 domain-containing protein [Vallitaleaceae bacterium]|nr:DUF3383 domain-containing protein [Vallitaleaceae bacterium]